MSHRRTWWRATAAILLACAGGLATAQDYPAKPIHLVVGFPPGAQSDATGRLVAGRLAAVLGQAVVVENRPGAGGTIAGEFVARAAPDGYTLLLGSPNTLTLAPLLFTALRYDPLRDFVAIGRFVRIPMVVAASVRVPAANLTELAAFARANPGVLTCATGAPSGQIAVELLMSQAAVEIVHVPYKGAAAAVGDVVAGHVDLAFADLSALAPHAQAGTIRLLAITGPTRLREAPDVPTASEQGFPDFFAYSWQAIVAPSSTPPAVVTKLRAALHEVAKSKDFIAALERMGFEALNDDPAAFPALLRSEIEYYRPLVKKAGLRADPP